MKPPGRWPLLLIAAPAAVAIWSGWVGLGGLCGFGPVNLAPGIGSGFTLNTAITLPIGVEAYAAYALRWWMDPKAPPRARKFAQWSALGALGYGMLGQVVYHLLAAARVTEAPWPVVVLVSCMPVVVLGFAAALTHLLRAAEDVAGEPAPTVPSTGSPATKPGTVPSSGFEAAKTRMRQAADLGFRYTDNQAREDFHLTRAAAAEARRQVSEDAPAGAPAGAVYSPAPAHPPNAPAGVVFSGNGHPVG